METPINVSPVEAFFTTPSTFLFWAERLTANINNRKDKKQALVRTPRMTSRVFFTFNNLFFIRIKIRIVCCKGRGIFAFPFNYQPLKRGLICVRKRADLNFPSSVGGTYDTIEYRGKHSNPLVFPREGKLQEKAPAGKRSDEGLHTMNRQFLFPIHLIYSMLLIVFSSTPFPCYIHLLPPLTTYLRVGCSLSPSNKGTFIRTRYGLEREMRGRR